MQVREAKDFLVGETAEQARLEGVPLSELEKRMMYFTESGYVPEDPIALNEKFEAEYETDEYEGEIHGLMHRACARIQKESPATARQWKEAIRELGKEDHYISVLWGDGILAANYLAADGSKDPPLQRRRAPFDRLKLFGASLLVAGIGVGVLVLADHYGVHFMTGRRGDVPATQTQMPVWIQRGLILSFLGCYIYLAVLPLIMKKSPPGLQELWVKGFRVGAKKISDDK